jgi:hypothetical protein
MKEVSGDQTHLRMNLSLSDREKNVTKGIRIEG